MSYDSASSSVTSRSVSPELGLRVRTMRAADLPHVQRLHAQLLPFAYPTAFFVQLLVQPDRFCLVVLDDEDEDNGGAIPVAFITATLDRAASAVPISLSKSSLHDDTEDDIQNVPLISILTLGVAPSHRRRGLARALIHDVTRKLQGRLQHSPSLQCTCNPLGPKTCKRTTAARGRARVVAQVAAANEGGRKFYRTLGLEEQEVHRGMFRASASASADASSNGWKGARDGCVVSGVLTVL